MQKRTILACLLVVNGMGFNGSVRCDENYDACGGDDINLWLPTFPALAVDLTHQEIAQRTDINDATFDTQIAAVNAAFKAALRQCIVNGVLAEEQFLALMEPVKQAYMAYVREVAFLVFAKAERLKDEAQYQAYMAQIAALRATMQATAHQAGDTWFAVEAGNDTTAHALSVSEGAASTIDAQQAQIDAINALVQALLVELANQPY